MTKTRVRHIFVFISMLCCSLPSFSQSRYDVELEGPWILYELPGFFSGGKLALVLIAPKADNHDDPLFSTGDGAKIPSLGIYCLGYLISGDNFSCSSNAAGPLTYKLDYPNPEPVEPTKPSNWDYTNYSSSAYIIILPMPDTYSADGKYDFTFEDAFPSVSVTPAYTGGPKAIGAQLHYAQGGPGAFRLLKCVGAPSIANCKTKVISDDQINSGTLRIQIKNTEDFNDVCDYHVRGAYHKMIGILDPAKTNKSIAYINVQKFDDCAKCDPQSTPVTGCPTMSQVVVDPLDISRKLNGVVTSLERLPLEQQGPAQVNELSGLSKTLNEKSPTLSRLLELESYLAASEAFFLNNGSVNKFVAQRGLLPVEGEEVGLSTASAALRSSFRSGKDCRAALMHLN